MKQVTQPQKEVKELIKPARDLEMDYGLVQAYCESRDSCGERDNCSITNKSMDTEEDILF